MNITPTWKSILYVIVDEVRRKAPDERSVEAVRQLGEIGEDYNSRHPGSYEPGHWQQRTEDLLVRLKGTKGRKSAAINAAVEELYTLAEIADQAVAETRS